MEITRAQNGRLIRYDAHPVVESVDPGSPALKAGIRSGDVIIAINGREFRTGDLIMPEALRPGAKVPVKAVRKGSTHIFRVQVQPRPEGFETPPCPWMDATIATAIAPQPNELAFAFVVADSSGQRRVLLPSPRPTPAPASARTPSAPRPPDMVTLAPGPFASVFVGGTSVIIGAQLIPMNDELGETFGVNEGLLVLKVLPGTPADASGLRGGDVLLTANDQDLASVRVLQREMNLAADREVKLQIVRQKKRQTVMLRW
jgi:S1-C subfamily serine protease